jgi:hypothetical protein
MYVLSEYCSHLINALKKEYPWVNWNSGFISQSIDDFYIYSDVFENDVEYPDGGHVSGVSFTGSKVGKYPIKIYGMSSEKDFTVTSKTDWRNHFPHILYRHRELAALKKNLEEHPPIDSAKEALVSSLTMMAVALKNLKKKHRELELERDALEFKFNSLKKKTKKTKIVPRPKAVPKGQVIVHREEDSEASE